MPDDVGRWLEELGLGQYGESFADNYVDGAVLADLTSEDLKDLGVAAAGYDLD